MIFVLLAVSGKDWDPEFILHQFQIDGCQIWRQGNALKFGRGRIHDDSGFSTSLPEQPYWAAAQDEIRALLALFKPLLSSLDAKAVIIELSIGLTVGSSDAYVSSISLPVDFLAELATWKVNLSVTGYPTSDETPDDPS
jgi:hypothetical protein